MEGRTHIILAVGNTSLLLGAVAGVLAFLSYTFYVGSILVGKTIPNRASWWIWALLGFVVLSSYKFGGASATIWAPLSEAIGPLISAILSIKYGEGGWSPFDRRCLFGVLISLVLWAVFNSPLVALISGLTIDLFAALPTIRKSYLRPKDENKTAWILVVLANAINILAIERWSLSIAIQPIYMTVITSLILIPLLISKKSTQYE